MNITIVVEIMVSALIIAALLMTLLEAPAMALGPTGKCYVDCTGGGIPSDVREHNVCLSACIFGEGVQRLDDGMLLPLPLPSDRPRGQQTGRK